MALNKVSIIVTSYRPEAKKYLDLCVDSIRNLDYPKYLIETVIVGGPGYLPPYEGCKTTAPDLPEWAPPVGINHGFKSASPDSKYLLMLNDDAMLTKNSLKNMVDAAGDNDVILNPISPCDNYAYYQLMMGYKKGDGFVQMTNRFYRLPDYEEDAKLMMNAESLYGPGFIWMNELCMYATLYPRKVYERIGPWDEALTYQDDIDYSWRAKQRGVALAACMNALIWHAGGASNQLNDESRKDSVRRFYNKWKKPPPGMTEEQCV